MENYVTNIIRRYNRADVEQLTIKATEKIENGKTSPAS